MNTYYTTLDALIRPTRSRDLPIDLTPMRHLIAALDLPPIPTVIVAGSTGKTTTAGRLAATLIADGVRVGVYTSPHLHSYRERICIDGALITPAQVVSAWARVAAAEAKLGRLYTTFERTTALALVAFAEAGAQMAVMECGIGGRYDAVNAIDGVIASLILPIELEHTAMLGRSLIRIAWHKAGIMRRDRPTFTCSGQSTLVSSLLVDEAHVQKARLHFVDDPAVGAFHFLRPRSAVDPAAVETPFLPARMERARLHGRPILIDGGHTPRAARRLRDALTDGSPKHLLIAMLRDKDAAAYLREFDLPGWRWTLTQVASERSATPDALAKSYSARHAEIGFNDDPLLLLGDAALDCPIDAVAGTFRLAAQARIACGLLSEAERDEAERTRALFEGAGYRQRIG